MHHAANNRERVWFRGSQTQFNNKTALFINGVPQRDYFGGYPSDWEMPLANIKKIEIIRGPGSALYGANAFSGVISIFTYQPGEVEGGKIAAISGNFGTTGVNFLADHKASFGNWLLEGNFFDTDGQTYPIDRKGNPITRSAAQKNAVINISGGFLDNKLTTHVGYRKFNNLNVSKGDNRPTEREWSTLQFDAKYTQQLAKAGAEIVYGGYYFNPDRDELESRFKADGSLNKAENYIDETSILGVNALLTYPLSQSNELVVGAEVQQEKLLKSEFYTIRPGQQTSISSFVHKAEFKDLSVINSALYVQNRQDFREGKMSVTLGLRADFQDLFGTQVTSRIGLVNQFSSAVFGKLLFGTAFRAPSPLEFTRVPDDPSIVAADVEKITTFEMQMGFSDDNNLHTITYFNNHYKDFIDRIGECFSGDNSGLVGCGDFSEIFGATGKRSMQGVELELKTFVTKQTDVFFNATYLDTEDDRTQDRIPLLSEWTLSAGFNSSHNLAQGKLSVSSYIYSYGDRGDWNPALVNRSGLAIPREDALSQGFFVWNGKVGYEVKEGAVKGMMASFDIKNILDEKYANQDLKGHSSRFDGNGQEKTFSVNYDSQYDERTFFVSLGYQW